MRVKMDGLAASMKLYNIEPKSAEVFNSMTELLFAKAWLGKVLGSMKVESPYQNDGKRQDVKDIEPTADTGDTIDSLKALNRVQRVDWMRVAVGAMADSINKLINLQDGASKSTTFMIWCYKDLCKSRFWLGFELERLRTEMESDTDSTGPEGAAV